jgi:hypothetical protein
VRGENRAAEASGSVTPGFSRAPPSLTTSEQAGECERYVTRHRRPRWLVNLGACGAAARLDDPVPGPVTAFGGLDRQERTRLSPARGSARRPQTRRHHLAAGLRPGLLTAPSRAAGQATSPMMVGRPHRHRGRRITTSEHPYRSDTGHGPACEASAGTLGTSANVSRPRSIGHDGGSYGQAAGGD